MQLECLICNKKYNKLLKTLIIIHFIAFSHKWGSQVSFVPCRSDGGIVMCAAAR